MKSFALTFLILFFTTVIYAENVLIPDTNFKNALIELGLDINKDGEISIDEAEATTHLDVSAKDISNMTGIEAFKNLESLNCSENILTSLDVSANTSLERLQCYYVKITSLDVSRNTALKVLDLFLLPLDSLDISNNSALIELNCVGSELTSLDVSKNTTLERLICSSSEIKSLNVSNNPNLKVLQCDDNQLTSLDVSKCKALVMLAIGTNNPYSIHPPTGNKISNLDISNNPNLSKLFCDFNQITNLDVSANTALSELTCSNNLLIGLDISNNSSLWHLSCSSNSLTQLNVSACDSLKWLYCNDNQLTSLDVSENKALFDLSCSNNLLTILDVLNNSNLGLLNCNSNRLASLDLSRNMNLFNLHLSTMPTLFEVCVRELPLSPEDYYVDITGSPNISFSTNCLENKRRSEYTIEDWRMEIDEYWGEGDPTDKKLAIFDEIWKKIDEGFNTFQNLEIDWNALREKYRPEIEAGVSQGRFVGIINSMGRQLQETHLWLYHKPINLAPKIEPGAPVMSISSFANNRHFGATLTPLPDSSLLIYKAFPNHPLGLVPGDIVLGYEGVPWKKLYKSLLAAELPLKLNGISGSTKEACDHIYLSSAGLNWHLFDTIDIIKYYSRDTLHLPTTNLAGQKGRIMGSDQVPVNGVDFWTQEGTDVISMDTTSGFYWLTPDINADYLTYGILDNTDIGYIYLSTASNHNVSNLPSKLLQAFKALDQENIKGVIFDLRYNTGGSWSAMDNVFAYIYQNGFNVTNMFTRSSTEDHFLMKPWSILFGQDAGTSTVTIRANTATNYNNPIALLTGPGCVSAGEYAVLKFKKYDLLRIFGKTTAGSVTVGDAVNSLRSSDKWFFGQAQGNTKLFEDSTRYMSHTGLEVDEEIWFDRESVSMGVDNIVSRAVEWIQNETIKVKSPIIGKSDDEILLTFYPNPFKEDAFLSVQLKNAGNLEIKIFNSTGKMIEYFNRYGEKGMNEFKISGEKIGEGIYFYQVSTRKYSKSGKIIKLN